jgi:hypothetical protein
MMALRQIDPNGEADVSATASDAGSTISTNPASIFSNTNTVRFGNVLSLEDFKGCPCPLDDIVEHEHPRGARSTSPRSPRSVRVNQSSRAASPDNQYDLDGDEVVSNPPEEEVKGFFAHMGLDDGNEDAMLQLAMFASLSDHSGPNGGSAGRLHGDERGRRHGDERDGGLSAGARGEPFAAPVAMSANKRGKQPLYHGMHQVAQGR